MLIVKLLAICGIRLAMILAGVIVLDNMSEIGSLRQWQQKGHEQSQNQSQAAQAVSLRVCTRKYFGKILHVC